MLIFKAGTGIGKSVVLVPQLFTKFRQSIVCTQPKISNVVNITNSINELYADLHLGENLGMKTSVDARFATTDINLFFCTTEILNIDIRRAIDTRTRINYRFIIVDEVHEQSIEMLNLLNNIKFY